MIKYTFVAYHRDMSDFLQRLQELGVVDVSRRNAEPGEAEISLLQQLDRYAAAEKLLHQVAETEKITHSTAAPYSASELLNEVENLRSEQQQLEAKQKKAEKDAEALRPWGEFSVETVKQLSEQGVQLRFFTCGKKQLNQAWKNDYALQIVGETATELYFVAAQHSSDEPFVLNGAQEQKMPTFSYKNKENEATEIGERMAQIGMRLKELAVLRSAFKPAKASLLNELQLHMAQGNTTAEADSTLAILNGFCPVTKHEELTQFLAEQEIVYFASEATTEDDAPVLLKNSKFAKLFEPITSLFALPNYQELDLTPLFAPFFMMFFGFCLGDAGYGVLILLISLFVKRKVPQAARGIVTLAQYMGLATVIFGALTGTFFGVALVEVEAMKGVRSFFLNQDKLMLLSLALGFVQIIFGMGVKAVNIAVQKGVKHALAQVASLLLTISGAAYFGLPMMDIAVSGTLSYALLGTLGASAAVFFFYNTPGKNPLLNLGTGLWNFYGLASGLLGDMLSYIRLFALGLTGGILGGVFNSLALDVGQNGIGGIIGMVLIMLVGHGLNIMLSILGAIVHPLRLTFVEFYKNAGFEGGGREYKPLKSN
jgi:V/A-type H+-transporting ATPase subunit I